MDLDMLLMAVMIEITIVDIKVRAMEMVKIKEEINPQIFKIVVQ
jgi:hypothetical protein